MMSSAGYPPSLSLEGIFEEDPTRSPFHSANKVYVAYCTSDGWVGDAAASQETWGYHFRGQRVLRSALSDLVSRGKLTVNSSILLGGGSAGARGMMNNVDFLSSYLPNGSTDTLLGAFLDSPYYIDIEPFPSSSSAGYEGLPYETQQIYQRYNVSAIIPRACEEKYPNDEGWKCLYGQYRMPFLQTPYLLIASHYDSYQLSMNLGANPVDGRYETAAMDDYAALFARRTKALLTELSQTASMNGRALIHSWGCYNHCTSGGMGYYAFSSNGITQYNATEELQKRTDTTSAVWIESCSGNFCGVDCE
jgi:O-palmitoleoyl-L-serine hydrolase